MSPKRIYRRLLRARGPAGWWPGETAFEVCVGAILVQNTAWPNADRALRALKERGLLSYQGLKGLGAEDIAPIIRSSGTFNVKARRLASFVDFLGRRYGGRVEEMAREEPWELRRKLLGVPGIGRETADCIVLYAAGHPLFVVDGYTRRIFSRLGMIRGDESYEDVQRFFMRRLPGEARLFNDYHAQIVGLAQESCRARPVCATCPLDDVCLKIGTDAPRGRRGSRRKASRGPRGSRGGAQERRMRIDHGPGWTAMALVATIWIGAAGCRDHSVSASNSPSAVAAPSAVSAVTPLSSASSALFWAHWGDGRAEMNGYRLVQPRYGAPRTGSAVYIFVTEDFSDSARVKADPGQHPASDVYPVMKLNAVRHFQTGIYDYKVMTSTFARVAAGWPLAKVSFSSQEWCGHVYHEILPRGGKAEGVFHSYFDGEADGQDDLPQPEGGVFEDALPILARGWGTTYLQPGESRRVPFLPSLLRARLDHKRLAWGQATISRSAATPTVKVPAGAFDASVWTVAEEGGRTLRYQIEAAVPHRLVRWSTDAGEEGSLLGSTRLAYWKLNGPGGEEHLAEIGLKPASMLK